MVWMAFYDAQDNRKIMSHNLWFRYDAFFSSIIIYSNILIYKCFTKKS